MKPEDAKLAIKKYETIERQHKGLKQVIVDFERMLNLAKKSSVEADTDFIMRMDERLSKLKADAELSEMIFDLVSKNNILDDMKKEAAQ